MTYGTLADQRERVQAASVLISPPSSVRRRLTRSLSATRKALCPRDYRRLRPPRGIVDDPSYRVLTHRYRFFVTLDADLTLLALMPVESATVGKPTAGIFCAKCAWRVQRLAERLLGPGRYEHPRDE